jgi:thioredoxin reductase (NADPH)
LAKEYDIVIAGGGIAGLTAGRAAAKNGLNTFMLSGNVLGGNLLSIEKIDGFPGYPDGIAGYDLCPITQGDAVQAGAGLAPLEMTGLEENDGTWLIHTEKDDFVAKAVVLAMGASLRKLGVPGEDTFFGKGVSHCASCDAPLMRDKTVVVIGGGDSALQEALTLAGFVDKVILLQDGDALTGQSFYVDQVKDNAKFDIRFNIEVTEIIGSETVQGVKLNNGEEISAEGVFAYIGLQPNSQIITSLLNLDDTGRIIVDPEMRSERPGILAAGTLRGGAPGRAGAAAEDGEKAAQAAAYYIANNKWQ